MSTYILVFLTVLGASWTLYIFSYYRSYTHKIRICYLCRLMLYRLTDSGQYVSYDLISTDSEILQHPSRQGGRDYIDSSNSFFSFGTSEPAPSSFELISLNYAKFSYDNQNTLQILLRHHSTFPTTYRVMIACNSSQYKSVFKYRQTCKWTMVHI